MVDDDGRGGAPVGLMLQGHGNTLDAGHGHGRAWHRRPSGRPDAWRMKGWGVLARAQAGGARGSGRRRRTPSPAAGAAGGLMRGPMAPLGESGDVRTWRRDAILTGIGAPRRLCHGRPHRGAHGSGRAQDGGEIGLPLPSVGQLGPAWRASGAAAMPRPRRGAAAAGAA